MSQSSTVGSASINLVNTIIGAGILAMPYGLKCNGIVLGIFVIILSAVSSSFGLYLQGKCSRYAPTGHSSFFTLSSLTYPSLGVLFDLAIAVKCLGVGISYLVVIGDLMPKIIESIMKVDEHSNNEWLVNRNFWITAFMLLVIIPLCFLRSLDSLKYTSLVALTSVAYLIVLVVEHFFKHDISYNDPLATDINIWKPSSISAVISTFPIFVFAYTCHQNMFGLINELRDKSSKAINSVIKIAIGIAASSYILVGLTGYLTFGNKVGGNIITMYPKSLSSTIGRMAIVTLVMLSFPLQCHPCRMSINHVIHHFAGQHQAPQDQYQAVEDVFDNDEIEHERLLIEEQVSTQPLSTDGHGAIIVPLGNQRFISITSFIILFSYLVAISVRSLEHVLAFVGSTGSTSISFILPGIFAYSLIGSEKIDVGEALTAKDKFLKYGGLALACWGVVVMIVCLSATILFGATH